MVGPIERTIRVGAGLAFTTLLALLALAGQSSAATTQGGIGTVPAAAPAPPATAPLGKPLFPIRGPHEYWAGMGAGRGHQGVDVGAACGTPLVAVGAGRIRVSKYHSRAGNYAVLDLKDSTLDLVYAHMVEPALVPAGQVVAAGQQIGLVGDTGNASGCHLHFEVWDGVYYGGGAVIDPMPLLESWEPRKRLRQRSR